MSRSEALEEVVAFMEWLVLCDVVSLADVVTLHRWIVEANDALESASLEEQEAFALLLSERLKEMGEGKLLHEVALQMDHAIVSVGSVWTIGLEDKKTIQSLRERVEQLRSHNATLVFEQLIHLEALEARLAQLEHDSSLADELYERAEAALIRLPMKDNVTDAHRAQVKEARQYVDAAKAFGYTFVNEWKLMEAELALREQ
ncbi:hypothetical protein GOP80_00220 [Planococcaceae bacterium Storch 2/2-2]|nr:hypothetical protein [Planococcaceae bacterium Storch 2/2-2]